MRAPLKNLLPCLLIPALASCSVVRDGMLSYWQHR